MEFSELILHYVQKHYSPLATRIVHILIIASIAISSAILLLTQSSNSPALIIMIPYSIFIGVSIIILITNQKNNSVEKIEKAIILNIKTIDNLDEDRFVKMTIEENTLKITPIRVPQDKEGDE